VISAKLSEREPYVQRLWLVRHGITVWNSEKRLCGHHNISLSEEGQMQADWIAQQLSALHLSAIYTSDLLRAEQTAGYIASQSPSSVSVISSPVWREMSFGDWEGLNYTEIAEQFPQYLAFFTDPMRCTPPGGEAFSALVQRVKDAFGLLVQAISGNNNTKSDIVLVSHGGPLRVLLCWLLSLPFELQWRLSMDHGSLSAIDFVPGADDVPSTVTLALFNMHAGLSKRGHHTKLRSNGQS
jgi:broad specificity phosphatase PhoE